MNIDFPNKGSWELNVAEAERADFRCGLRALRDIVDFYRETDGTQVTPYPMSHADIPRALRALEQATSIRLAYGQYVRRGMPVSVERGIAVETGTGVSYHPLDRDSRVAGSIKGCRVASLPELRDLVDYPDHDTITPGATLLLELDRAVLYQVDEFGEMEFIEYSFTGKVYLPVCDERISRALLMEKTPVVEEHTVKPQIPRDGYLRLFGSEIVNALEANDPGSMTRIKQRKRAEQPES